MSGLPPQDREWEDLLDPRPAASPAEVVAEMNQLLGRGPGYERPPRDLPDVSGLRSQIFDGEA